MRTQRNSRQNGATKTNETVFPDTDPALRFERLCHYRAGAGSEAMRHIRNINEIAEYASVGNVDSKHGCKHTMRTYINVITDVDASIQGASAVRRACFQSAMPQYMRISPNANLPGIQNVSRQADS
jgi:hypothetical protein